MARHCELVLDPKRAVRAVMVYHQYGFPQDMDAIRDHCAPRHIAIIENCANVWEGYYKQELLGTLGLSGIFSLSKLFPSLSGVGLAIRDKSRCLRPCFIMAFWRVWASAWFTFAGAFRSSCCVASL